MIINPGRGRGSLRHLEVAKRCGLAGSSLKLCLDPADNRSYSGSGQTFNDRTANGHNFNVGKTSGAETSDPTFTGTANTLAAYFLHDGGDFFELASANPTWVDDIHKDNAQATLAFWWWIPSFATAMRFAGTTSTSSAGATGFRWGPTDADSMTFTVHNSGAVLAAMLDFGATFPTSAWAFYCVSINEATGSLIGGCNGSYTTASSTYTSPGTGSALERLQIGASNGQAIVPADTRFGGGWMWNTALTEAQMTRIFNASRRRFGV